MKINTRTKFFLFASSFVLLGLSVGLYFLFWVFGSIQQKRESIDVLLARDEINTEKMKQREELLDRYNFVLEKEGIIENVFVRKEDLIHTIERVESLAQLSGVEVKLDIQEGPVKKPKPKTAAPVKDTRTDQEKKEQAEQEKNQFTFFVEIHGTYPATMNYLDRLDRMSPVASFESIKMDKDDQNTDQSNALVEGGLDQQPLPVDQKVITNVTLSFMQFWELKS